MVHSVRPSVLRTIFVDFIHFIAKVDLERWFLLKPLEMPDDLWHSCFIYKPYVRRDMGRCKYISPGMSFRTPTSAARLCFGSADTGSPPRGSDIVSYRWYVIRMSRHRCFETYNHHVCEWNIIDMMTCGSPCWHFTVDFKWGNWNADGMRLDGRDGEETVKSFV